MQHERGDNLISRRGFIRASALSVGLAGAFGGVSCAQSGSAARAGDAVSTSDAAQLDGPFAMSFVVMSDTHIDVELGRNREHLHNALSDIRSFSPEPAAIVIVGDITERGEEEEYELVREICSEEGFDFDTDIVKVMGNHDQYSTEFDPERAGLDVQYLRFMEQTGVSHVYHDSIIDGQHFICLGPDENTSGSWARFNFTDDQIEWLEQLLEEDLRARRFSFVFCHEPLNNTVKHTEKGSWAAENSIEDNEELFKVLNGRSNVVYFAGHTHLYPDLALPVADGPLFVNDGAVGPGQVAPGQMGTYPDDFYGSHGWLVSVYSDRIELKARDFNARGWIEGLDYTFPLKFPDVK